MLCICYNTVVTNVLREMVSGKSSIAPDDKTEREKWKRIEKKYHEGAINQYEAGMIMTGLHKTVAMMNSAPSMQMIGTFSVTRGALTKVTELIKKDMDENGEHYEEDAAEYKNIVPTEAPAPEKKKSRFLFWRK